MVLLPTCAESSSEIQITQGEDVAYFKNFAFITEKEEVSGLFAKDSEQSMGLPRYSMK